MFIANTQGSYQAASTSQQGKAQAAQTAFQHSRMQPAKQQSAELLNTWSTVC
jgi:hypothetical protein